MDSLIFVAVPVLIVGFFLFLLAKLLIAVIRWFNRHWKIFTDSFFLFQKTIRFLLECSLSALDELVISLFLFKIYYFLLYTERVCARPMARARANCIDVLTYRRICALFGTCSGLARQVSLWRTHIPPAQRPLAGKQRSARRQERSRGGNKKSREAHLSAVYVLVAWEL